MVGNTANLFNKCIIIDLFIFFVGFQEMPKEVPTLSSSEYGHRLELFADHPDRKHVRIAHVRAEFFRRNGITSWWHDSSQVMPLDSVFLFHRLLLSNFQKPNFFLIWSVVPHQRLNCLLCLSNAKWYAFQRFHCEENLVHCFPLHCPGAIVTHAVIVNLSIIMCICMLDTVVYSESFWLYN